MDPVTLATILIPVAVIVLFILIRMFRVIPEYERGISFRFGHLRSELKPGLNVVFPLVDSLQRVDMRVITCSPPPTLRAILWTAPAQSACYRSAPCPPVKPS